MKRKISTWTLPWNWKKTKTVGHESDSDTNCNWCSWYNHQRFGKMTRWHGNKRMGGDNSNYSIVEIGQNTEKSPGDLKRLAVTQTPERNHRLTLVWKTRKGVKLIIIKIKSPTRKRGHGFEKETLKEKLNLLTAAQNNAIRTNNIKAKIDNLQA